MDCIDRFFIKEREQLVLVASKYVRQNASDLVQDVIVQIYSDKDKYFKICEREELFFYLIRIFRLAGFSKTSQYYYKYRRHEDRHRPLDEGSFACEQPAEEWMEREIQLDLWTAKMMASVEHVLTDLNWFESQLFKIYYLHNHTITTLSNDTGISRTTINRSIRKTKAYLQKTYSEKEADWTRGHGGENSEGDGGQSDSGSGYRRLRLRGPQEET
tara:strand:+ start:1982 stop:2626 length:645 start_codon:yes stop_codon:yes gene_type:complete